MSSAPSSPRAPFGPVGALDLPRLEEGLLARWRDEQLFERTIAAREGAPEWVFYEGPPTANGRPGTHHVWARVFKDLYPRFHTMRGRQVARKGGWDCHGLPVEIEVEKELGLTGKAQIEEYGIEAFNRRCRESVTRYVDEFARLTERIGMWLDVDDAYWTLSNDYIESVWWIVRQMYDKGLVYEGFKVVPYCGRCGTALSSHEVALGYRDVTEPSVYVRFPVVDADFDLLVWTTTPWTLISNVAAAVGPDVPYVRVRTGTGERDVVLAASRVEAVLGEGAVVVGPVAASDLAGRHYERPFDVLPMGEARTVDGGVPEQPAHRVVVDGFVTADDGSGIVHLAPAFGEVDREVGARENLPVLNPVDAAARFDASVPAYAGRFVKDADPAIIDALAAAGRLVAAVEHTHSYPHCWRCGTPLVYWAKTSWFARTSARKAEMLAQNATVGWHPEHIRDGRFGDWLANNVDWALSRDRYWGTPIPIWQCGEDHDTVIGSVAELSGLAGRDLSDLDLHRPYVDDVTFPCPVDGCGAEARRVGSVLDTWFDSGSMPSAQLHYPFEHADVFERRFPADFICEAIDQTRGWFYSLLAVNTLVFDQTPYRNVVCLAHIVDKDGAKMSKSKGNVIDPWTLLDGRGADAIRWYFFSAGSPWTNRRVFPEAIDEATRGTLLTLWNTYSFFATYADLDGWTADAAPATPSTHVLDRWVRSRLHGTVGTVTAALDDFDALAAAEAIAGFVDDLSNWYVRRSRPRFWKASDAGAHATLHEALVTVARLLAPLTPFLADAMHRGLVGTGADDTGASVHLADWPVVDAAAVDPELEAAMARARRFVELGRRARSDAKIGVRQPLPRVLLFAAGGAGLDAELQAQVAEELNVKAIEELAALDGLVRSEVSPNFKALGPRLGKQVQRVKALLADVDGADVQRAFDDGRPFVLVVDGEPVELGPADVEVRAAAHEELAVAQDGPVAVALDLHIDDDLRLEGLARELVRAINDLRKAEGFAIADRIGVVVSAGDPLAEAARRHAEWVAGEVLATSFAVVGAGAPGTTVTVGGHDATIALTRAG
jgi:isoleucyl-tRNA synthetase